MEELDAALFNMRKAIEAVCTSIIQKENFKTDSRKPNLEQKLSTIANKINANEFSMPRPLSLEMMHVQKIGNYATHDQEDEIPVSKASAQAALILTKEIKDWYFGHYNMHRSWNIHDHQIAGYTHLFIFIFSYLFFSN